MTGYNICYEYADVTAETFVVSNGILGRVRVRGIDTGIVFEDRFENRYCDGTVSMGGGFLGCSQCTTTYRSPDCFKRGNTSASCDGFAECVKGPCEKNFVEDHAFAEHNCPEPERWLCEAETRVDFLGIKGFAHCDFDSRIYVSSAGFNDCDGRNSFSRDSAPCPN